MVGDSFDPQLLVVDHQAHALVAGALSEFGPLTEADLVATTEVPGGDVRRVLADLAASGRARHTSSGWETTGVVEPRRWYRQGGRHHPEP